MKLRRSVETPLVLALDIGSSSVRSGLFDRLGRKLNGTQASISHQVATTAEGGAELEADKVVANSVACIEESLRLAASLSIADHIAGVGVSTFWHSFLGIDNSNKAVTPIYMWSDLRSWPQALQLRQRLNELEIHKRTGCVIHPCYLPAKILWLKAAQPELFGVCHKFVSIGEYLFLHLFGAATCSLSMASGTGFLDQSQLTWNEEIMEALGISAEKFLPLVDVDVPQIGIQREYEGGLGRLKEVPWFPALGDGACSNIGSGCVDTNRIALMVGTSGAMRVICEDKDEGGGRRAGGENDKRPQFPQGLWCYRVDRRRYIIGGALSNGGSVYAWLKDFLKFDMDSKRIESELEALEPDSHGITILPFLAGERNPDWPLNATAVIAGLRSHSRPLELLRAAFEAVAYRFAIIYELLAKAVPETEEIVVSGGILKSRVWVQIIADVLGRAVIESEEPEASSRGAALMALSSLGLIQDLKEIPAPLGASYEPNREYHERYIIGLERHKKLYRQFLNSWNKR